MCWPAPENPETINRKQLGNLKLSDKQEDLLVAFLKTLTDGYVLPEKRCPGLRAQNSSLRASCTDRGPPI
jgi:hypothetical protein